jgi:hypothetical protein
MIVSINQPAYLPWPGSFHRIALSDVHIVLDHVQFEKNSFVNRNKVRTRQGWCWLTVPLKTGGRFGRLGIDQVEIANDTPWPRKHWETLRCHYGKLAGFAAHAAFFEDLYRRPWDRLSPLLRETHGYLLRELGIRVPLLRSSEMGVAGSKDDLILNLCKAAGARTYLSGPLGRNYLREEIFEREGIRVAYHDYRPPVYAQAAPGFEPGLSVVDLLFHCGGEAREILMQGQEAVPA